MKRSKNYNEVISKKLKDPEYAQEYLNALMEGSDGLGPEEALRDMIEVMGITDFSAFANVSKQRVEEFTSQKRTFKPATLDIFLKPLKLKTKLIFEKIT